MGYESIEEKLREEQIEGEAFIFGPEMTAPHKDPVCWNPDSSLSINPHLMICGTSGSGKTTLMKQKVRYLQKRQKNIYLFDLQGDFKLEGENHIEFTAWNSEYGINPFDFDTGVQEAELKSIIDGVCIPTREQMSAIQNSGPEPHTQEMTETIKSIFMPNMGTSQEGVLKRLFKDTYKIKGIVHDDFKSWMLPLPSLIDMRELIVKIQEEFEGRDIGLNRNAIKTMKNINKIIEEEAEDGGFEKLRELIDENEKIEAFVACHNLLESYLINHSLKQDSDKKDDFFSEFDIDVEFYMKKDVIRVVEKLAFHVELLIESGVFHSKKPPTVAGLNRIDISGLRLEIQRIFVRIFTSRIFRGCKIRGPYLDLPTRASNEKKTLKSRVVNTKVDTYIVVDEARLVVPKGREKTDPSNVSTRITLEGRKYGLGQLLAAQSSGHYPEEFLKNFDAQVILTVNKADYDTTRKNFGIQKEQIDMTRDYGIALVKTRVGFTPVRLPWNEQRKKSLIK